MTKDLPRVTAIIAAAGLSGDMSHIPQHALDRGTAVHAACAMHDQGLEMEPLHAEVQPRFNAWLKYRRDTGATPRLVEHAVTGRGYRGTLDRVMMVGERMVLVDIKCGQHARWHGIQLAAYAYALPVLPDVAACVHLANDGTYTVCAYTRAEISDHYVVFLAALKIVAWKGV